MSQPPEESSEPSTEIPSPAEGPAERYSFVALIGFDGVEPSAHLSEREAKGAWSAISAAWHPSLLALTAELPRIEDVASPTSPSTGEIRVVADGCLDRLPPDYRSRVEEVGAFLVEGTGDRPALVRAIQSRLGLESSAEASEDEALATATFDYLALGTARWLLRDLTIAMGHADCLDVESLTRETLAGAQAWQVGDAATATNRLRAAFELLTQARERFYPLDSYILDLCLVDPSTPAKALADTLAAHAPVTLIAPAWAIENLDRDDSTTVSGIREAVTEGWLDVAGGSETESDEPLLPVESILWQFRQGGMTYRRLLDDRNVETVARRRFALYPQLPQIAKRFGFRFAMHLGFDAGRFPIRHEAKRLWEGPDGSGLETLTRVPLGADRASQGPHAPWHLARTMKDDHVATMSFVHWPDQVAGWYLDLRRVAGYSPVLARWVTLNDYFHLTDRPFEQFRPGPDDYVTPYLDQAVARRDPRPISGRVEHAVLRARLDALGAVRALAQSLSTFATNVESDGPTPVDLERTVESGRNLEAQAALERLEPAWAASLTRGIVGSSTGGRPGYLVLNPLGVARRVAVLLPDAALDLRPEGPLRTAQFTDEGVWAVVELPAFGYAWVPREANVEVPPAASGGSLSAKDKVLRNESMAVEIDADTGGIRSLRSPSEQTARLGQQLVVTGLVGPDGAAVSSKMTCEGIEVDYGGPALVQAVSKGRIIDPSNGRRLASFRQRFRLWSGRPLLEVEVTLSDFDTEWTLRAAQADPWSHAIACRWAWPDPSSMLRRLCLLSPELTEADRPETPDALDISTRKQRTALVFGGLAHHRRHGGRMLDTLLIAGAETERTFRVGVALDLENPFHASSDFVTPAYVVPTDAGPPSAGPVGWLVDLDMKSVAITRLEYAESTGEGRGWGIIVHLLETSGRAARCRLRTFRNPVWARQVDFNDELLVDVSIDGDAALIDLTPHELARVEITLG